ncbi:MAG: rhomboid family intramembrane serine protease [Candidatus Sulfotelmatobacter sp.]
MVGDSRTDFFGAWLDHDLYSDVHARQLVAHHRQHDFFVGVLAGDGRRDGARRYLVFYLVGGIVAMLAQIAASPHSTVPNLGASGAIAAVMGGFLVTYPHDRIRSILVIVIFVQITFIPAALLIGFWFLTQLFSAGQVAHAQTGGVAYLAHVGGFIFGAATARLFESAERRSVESGA